MKFGNVLILTGVILIVIAWVSATCIPSAAYQDFNKFVNSQGGTFTSSANFPDIYRQMSAQRRMLQNFYVGAVGMIFLTFGLNSWRKEAEPIAGAM
jgi:hypothetical protein